MDLKNSDNIGTFTLILSATIYNLLLAVTPEPYRYGGLSIKIVAIVQSNYIPWKGYFDLINMVDEFVLYDDAQYSRGDWRNRNRIKTSQGVQWLTIPVKSKGKSCQKINETIVSNASWASKHWKALALNYSRSPFFNQYENLFRTTYEESNGNLLSQVNYRFITIVCKILNISTKISWSMDYHLEGGKSQRLLNLCQQAKATHYISGPAAKDYLDVDLFHKAGIRVSWMDYSGYPEYPQLFGSFEHGVSIVDLIFNTGPNAASFMKSFASSTGESGT